jgi:hypothetical protein
VQQWPSRPAPSPAPTYPPRAIPGGAGCILFAQQQSGKLSPPTHLPFLLTLAPHDLGAHSSRAPPLFFPCRFTRTSAHTILCTVFQAAAAPSIAATNEYCNAGKYIHYSMLLAGRQNGASLGLCCGLVGWPVWVSGARLQLCWWRPLSSR